MGRGSGPHARRTYEVIVIIDSESEDDESPVVIISDNESEHVFMSHRRTPPRVVDVGPTSVGVDPTDVVYVGPASDGVALDGTFDMGPVVPEPVDDDVVGDRLVDVGPAVDGGGPAEVGPPSLRRRFSVPDDLWDVPEPLERFALLRGSFMDAHRTSIIRGS